MKKCFHTFWDVTKGVISKKSCDRLRKYLLEQYTDPYAQRKVLNFARAFLKYLAKTHFDARYQAFELFLELPKALKTRKHITQRIVTIADIKAIINAIASSSDLDERHRSNFKALVQFGAYTGQRPYATIRQLKAQQFHHAFGMEKPVLHVRAEQDKIRMGHYVPLHPRVVEAIKACESSRAGLMFAFESFQRWTREKRIPLARCSSHFTPSDLRKFAEQHGDVIGWEQSNRAYILTHGVSGVEWSHYRHPLPEYVYDVYLRYWGDVRF
ncbi:MAG: hypothetical protein ACXV4B_01615 [Halobacteriota archaeon]